MAQAIPDFDALWDYQHPDRTEAAFQAVLAQIPPDEPAALELLTQIARAQGLQRKFEQAHATLDQVEQRLGGEPQRAGVRYLLERGRVFNTSGQPEAARPLFEQAVALAGQLGEDFYVVDALHILAIIAAPEESLALNLQAIAAAENSRQERARGWLGSLNNNTGWSYFDAGNYPAALELFEKAKAFYRQAGREREARIAEWTCARALRALDRLDEALDRQMALKAALESVSDPDGYVYEEIGECLLALDRPAEARPYFARALEILSQDPWLPNDEPERLERLRWLAAEDQEDER